MAVPCNKRIGKIVRKVNVKIMKVQERKLSVANNFNHFTGKNLPSIKGKRKLR